MTDPESDHTLWHKIENITLIGRRFQCKFYWNDSTWFQFRPNCFNAAFLRSELLISVVIMLRLRLQFKIHFADELIWRVFFYYSLKLILNSKMLESKRKVFDLWTNNLKNVPFNGLEQRKATKSSRLNRAANHFFAQQWWKLLLIVPLLVRGAHRLSTRVVSASLTSWWSRIVIKAAAACSLCSFPACGPICSQTSHFI